MPLVYLPTDVKRELKLRTVAAARGLWSRKDFPGVIVDGRQVVDVDAFNSWWKQEWEKLTAKASVPALDPEPAPSPPPASSVAENVSPGGFDFSRMVIRPAAQRK